MATSKIIGSSAEDRAVEFLKRNGYKIIERNFNTKFGELDIVAKDRKTIVFAEVKYRENSEHGQPYEFVTKLKMEKLKKAAFVFLKQKNISDTDLRFDVISIIDDNIEHFKNAFV